MFEYCDGLTSRSELVELYYVLGYRIVTTSIR